MYQRIRALVGFRSLSHSHFYALPGRAAASTSATGAFAEILKRPETGSKHPRRLADRLYQPMRFFDQFGEFAAHGDRLTRKLAVLQRIAISEGGPTAGSMHSAHFKASDRWCPTGFPAALRSRPAPWGEMHGQLHGVDLDFFAHPLPPLPWFTLPTMACPPSLTETCCTMTRCSPPVRYRLSASTCAAKVLASLLKARSALSC